MPEDRCCVKHKWVLEFKCHRIFRVRLIACEYNHIAGVDFIQVFIPAAHDIPFSEECVNFERFGIT